MRRELATVVLIGLTLGSPSVGQAADLELESVPEGGRIEIPEAGFAITLPSDWRYTRPTLALIDELASSVPDGSVALARLLEELENDPPWLIALGPGSQGCDVSSLEAYDLSHDDFFAQTAAELADLGLDIRMDPVPMRLDLPVGEVTRGHMEWKVEGVDLQVTTYVIGSDLLLYTVACRGPSRPTDDWLSIVSTLELLPQGATGVPGSGNVLGSGRIERSDEGFAVAFPDSMWVAAVTSEQHDALWGDDVYGQQSRTLLWAEGVDHGDVCTFQDVSTWAGLPPPFGDVEEAVVFEVEQLLDGQDALSVADGEILDLPTGRVGRYTAVDPDGATVARYFFRNADAWFKLECHGPEPPPDRWLSIAESVEFPTPEDPAAPAASG